MSLNNCRKILFFICSIPLLFSCAYSELDQSSTPMVQIDEFPMQTGSQWNYEHSGIEVEYNDSTSLSIRRFNRDFTIKIEKDTGLQKDIIAKKFIFGTGLEDSTIRYFSTESTGVYEYVWYPLATLDEENQDTNASPWLKVLWLKFPLISKTSWDIENTTYSSAFGFEEKKVLDPYFFLVEGKEEQTLEILTSNLDVIKEFLIPNKKSISEWFSKNGLIKWVVHEEKIIALDNTGNPTGSYYDKDELYILKNYTFPKQTKR